MPKLDQILSHGNIIWTAFRRWLLAQILDAFLVGLLWLLGLWLLKIPLAPLWAVVVGIAAGAPFTGDHLRLPGKTRSYEEAKRNTSLSTPAAVTAGPAPGPEMTKGLDL